MGRGRDAVMPAPDEVNAPLTVRELIEELQSLADQDLPVMFAAISVDDYLDRIAYRMIHQNFTQEWVLWDEGIGEYRIVEEENCDCHDGPAKIAWVMN